MKIGYQGIKGAYSEVALQNKYGKDSESISYPNFEDIFEALNNDKIELGVIPVENTISGSISENYDLLLKNNLIVINELFLPLRHSLLSKKGNQLMNIKKVYSHPVALSQCKDFLKKNNIEPIPEYDTAGAAKIISERNNEDEAAIASDLAAEIYNLEILEKSIESNKYNTTRFFVITKTIPKEIKKEKTSIVIKTKHYPGALINCLQRLAKNDLNMTKLESRPIADNPWEYVFYVDFLGGTDDKNVQLTLKEMEAASIFVKVLGSYPMGKRSKQ